MTTKTVCFTPIGSTETVEASVTKHGRDDRDPRPGPDEWYTVEWVDSANLDESEMEGEAITQAFPEAFES